MSVYLSVTRWYCVETVKHIIILFHSRIATPVLVYDASIVLYCVLLNLSDVMGVTL